MRHDNAGGPVGDSFGEDLAWMNQASGERADGDDALGDQAIGAVEREANEVFLLFVTNVAQLLDSFFWRSKPPMWQYLTFIRLSE